MQAKSISLVITSEAFKMLSVYLQESNSSTSFLGADIAVYRPLDIAAMSAKGKSLKRRFLDDSTLTTKEILPEDRA
jgi:hypothetical protein